MKQLLFSAILALSFAFATVQCTNAQYVEGPRKFQLVNSADSGSILYVYLPSPDKATGRAIVDLPGGGYTHLAINHEGHDWANYFNDQGIALIVVKYRMPNGDRNIPLGDVYKAIKTVRDSAVVWHVDPQNVGIMGFSAGGHLASAVSTHAEAAVRPNFSILFYPVISMNENETHKGSTVGFLGDKRNDPVLQAEWSSDKAVKAGVTPPAILILAQDDGAVPPLTNALPYYTAMSKAGNKCAMMIYPSGGHGFGIKPTFRYHDQMLTELTAWMKNLNVPAKPKKDAAKKK